MLYKFSGNTEIQLGIMRIASQLLNRQFSMDLIMDRFNKCRQKRFVFLLYLGSATALYIFWCHRDGFYYTYVKK